MSFKSFTDLRQHFFRHRWFFLLVTTFCFGVYLNTLDNVFVSDDIYSIVNNPQLGNVSLALRQLSVYNLLKSLVYLCCGKSLFAYHLVNVILHVLASVLVYFFLLVVTKHRRISVVATLLFALHPTHTEAVSWVSGSGYVLYSVFFLASFLFYHLYLEIRQKTSFYLFISLFFYLLALSTSVWALPLALVFPLYEVYLRRREVNWLFYAILLILGGLLTFSLRSMVVARISSLAVGVGTAFRNPLVTIPHSLTQYFYLLFWPLRLTLYHEGEVLTSFYLLGAQITSFVFLFVLPFAFRKKRQFIFFFLFFLVSLALSLSPIQIGWYVAERYLYLPSISFCVLVAWFLLEMEKRLKIRDLATAMLIPILVLYGIRTWTRNQDWQSRASLWFATARVSPRSPKVHNNLGDIYAGRGDLDNAIKEFELARALRPGYADATHNLANTYLQRGDLDNAKKYFLEAIEFNPQLYQSFYSLGVVSYREGNLEEAGIYFERVLEIVPNYEPARKALEILEQEVGEPSF